MAPLAKSRDVLVLIRGTFSNVRSKASKCLFLQLQRTVTDDTNKEKYPALGERTRRLFLELV